jgi:hypothetical protein
VERLEVVVDALPTGTRARIGLAVASLRAAVDAVEAAVEGEAVGTPRLGHPAPTLSIDGGRAVRPGETCLGCGCPAVVVLYVDPLGEIGWCGSPDGPDVDEGAVADGGGATDDR